MKIGLFALLSFLFLNTAQAQEGTFFYTSLWEPCKERESAFKRVVTRLSADSGFYVKVYAKRGNILFMEGRYSSMVPEIEEGVFYFYHLWGNRNFTGVYTAGQMTGKWKIMDKKNRLIQELDYDIDTTASHIPMRRKPDIDTTKPIKEEMPYFGNDPTHKVMQQYVKDHIVYPPMAWIRKQHGKVRIGFVVERDGSLSSFQVIDAPYKDLGREALRVFSTMPNWEPGKMNGVPVPVKMTLPVKFYFDEY